MDYEFLYKFPPGREIETIDVLRKVASAHRALAELKGVSQTIPNQAILINTLSLQEAKDSSAIENIITTHDELFKENIQSDLTANAASKEVQRYTAALKRGFELVRDNQMLTLAHITEIQTVLVKNDAGFRKLPGTELKNDQTGEIIYTPPQFYNEIMELMTSLENFINDNSLSNLDPLVKMALIHYQFERIHPFYDGNGRTGRIINILYLVLKDLLNIPTLYLSRYIIKRKVEYYRLFQTVQEQNDWQPWLLFMLDGIEKTSLTTMRTIAAIRSLMMDYKHRIRNDFKFYSQELINNLFGHPYTKIDFVERDLNVTRKTATKYLEELVSSGFLTKKKLGISNFYINEPLFHILTREEE